jgi:hypothetical protein
VALKTTTRDGDACANALVLSNRTVWWCLVPGGFRAQFVSRCVAIVQIIPMAVPPARYGCCDFLNCAATGTDVFEIATFHGGFLRALLSASSPKDSWTMMRPCLPNLTAFLDEVKIGV